LESRGVSPVVVWFRRDLRLLDNPALAAAAAEGRPVIPVYLHDPLLEGRPIGAASAWWLDKSLQALAASLERIGSRLVLRSGDAIETLVALAAETGADTVFLNRLYEPEAAVRDEAAAARLEASGVTVRRFNASMLSEPGSVLTGSGGPYKVFGPFERALRAQGGPVLAPAPQRLASPAAWPAGENLAAWGLHPRDPDWSGRFGVWSPGEGGALDRLDGFVERALARYVAGRETPGAEGSSRLSPHLHFGEISPWRVVTSAQAAAERGEAPASAAEKLATEVAWRDFNRHLLAAFPHLPTTSFRPEFERFPWRRDPEALRAWKRGRTGYPIVDAGMRQLWATGWMHNRVRMIVASFLVKHLLIDWREGEAWFWDTLVDADLANNVGNWQWTAGSGADAAPYFRIFNPTTQGERFDPAGAYVRRWVPELAGLPDEALHAPWAAPAHILRQAGVRLGETYPAPIVDHAMARQRALAALASLRIHDQILT
jgi:deoxyribodipyrimidine photo-lyase